MLALSRSLKPRIVNRALMVRIAADELLPPESAAVAGISHFHFSTHLTSMMLRALRLSRREKHQSLAHV